MGTGSRYGVSHGLGRGGGRAIPRRRRRPGVGTFLDDEGGYTTIALVVAMLVSVTLVFGTAAAAWSQARAADVQQVADAAALAGENAVAGFTTVAQVSDACVLSMGIAGVVTLGAGLVLAAIPPAAAASEEVIQTGRTLLEDRRNFATSAAEGLQRLEAALPAIVMANASSCISANCAGAMEYSGTAVPCPLQSETDYSFLEKEAEETSEAEEELDENAEQLREAAEEKKEAEDRASEARERAWRADCVNDPKCLRERAGTLAGLSGAYNPNYESAAAWRFGYALRRATNYYRVRVRTERRASSSPREMSRSAARKRFYRYALEQLGKATCVEEGESVEVDLPVFPHNTDQVRGTTLVTESVWPCTDEPEGRTLHCSRDCPGATGASAGKASLAQVGAEVRECDRCHMSVATMGSVANASTNIDNGFEHYWRIIAEAGDDYTQAKEDEAAAEKKLEDAAERGEDLFDEAIKALAVDRPDFKPAGWQGCVAVVGRDGGVSVPTELTASFLSGASLPPGLAMSAAALAPEETADGTNVLSDLFSGIKSRTGFGAGNVADAVCDLWGKMLVGYGARYDSVKGDVDGFLDRFDGVTGIGVGGWLKNRISDIVAGAGFEPVDMRVRKPVLTHSQNVLDQTGAGHGIGVARQVLMEVPEDPQSAAKTLAREALNRLGVLDGTTFTVAEIEIPGTDVAVPLTIDLAGFLGS